MTADPTEPDTFTEEEAVELGEETPEADAAEQHAELRPHEDDPLTDAGPEEANVADLAEQARVVALDEDDYR